MSRKKKENLSESFYIKVIKYLISTAEDGNRYAVVQLKNNYKEKLQGIRIIVNQMDENGAKIMSNEICTNDLTINPHMKFVPYIRLMLDSRTTSLSFVLVEAIFEKHKYIEGTLEDKEVIEEEVETVKEVDSINDNVQTKSVKNPFKLFVVMSIISLSVLLGILVLFSLGNKNIIVDDIGINTRTGEIIGYYGNSNDVTIPEEIKGTKVVAIGERAFSNSSIVTVKIDVDVIEIKPEAFLNCINLEEIEATKVTYIGESAFENCTKLKDIKIVEIDNVLDSAFKNCNSLKEFSNQYVSTLGLNCFYYCNNLEKVYVPEATVTKQIFLECTNLKSFTFKNVDNSTTTTLSRIFSNDDTGSKIEINTYIEDVNNYFADDFKYSALNFLNPHANMSESFKAKYIANAKNQGKYFESAEYIRCFGTIIELNIDSPNFIIEDSQVKSINYNEFAKYARNYNNISINCNMRLEPELLNLCINLETLSIGENDLIAKGAICSTKLTNIIMPVCGVSFKDLFLMNSLTPINVELIGSVDIPNNYFSEASNVYSISVNGNITSIGKNAFANCSNLVSLNISNKVTLMGLPIIDSKTTKLSTLKIPFIGETIDKPCTYIELNQSSPYTRDIYITSTFPIKLKEKCFDSAISLHNMEIPFGLSECGDDALSRQFDKLLIGYDLGNNTLIKLLGNDNYVNTLAIRGANVPASFFEGININTLFLVSNTMINESSFTINDRINDIYIAKSVSGTNYETILDNNMNVRSIIYGNNPAYSYTNKVITVRDVEAYYNSYFN